jgi:hypothetical protein
MGNRFSPEVRVRAISRVFEHQGSYETHAAAIAASPGACGFPWFGVLARRYDSMGIPGGNRVVTLARIIGPISGR